MSAMRDFETGANRSNDAGKFDYEGFLNPLVLEVFAAYMDVNRVQADGAIRASDNWQKGMPSDVWVKSGLRHTIDFWKINRGVAVPEGELGAVGGILFNIMGWIHSRIQADPEWLSRELIKYRDYRNSELQARKVAP